MKRLLLFSFLAASAATVSAEDFRITVEPRKTGLRQGSGGTPQVGVATGASQTWSGEVKVENVGRQPSGPLRCNYVLYVKRQELGAKAGEDKVEEVSGGFEVPALNRGASFAANTEEVKLRIQSLAAGYYVKGGGQGKASDNVQGVWVKLFKGTSEIAEFVNPPTIKTKYKWK